MDKIDKKNQKTAFFQVFAERGHVIDCQLYQEKQRFDILNAQAKNFGIALSQNAWQQLMHHTEHNLLSAYQTLWRLSFLYNPAFGKSINETVMLDEMQLQRRFWSVSRILLLLIYPMPCLAVMAKKWWIF